jgi:WD40 repeat protein
VRRYAHSGDEEVNHIAVSPRGDLLAAADDGGEVAVIDLGTHAKARTLRRQHTNIASCVAWRPDRTAELLSAGLDARVVYWDASCGRVRRVGAACCCVCCRVCTTRDAHACSCVCVGVC